MAESESQFKKEMEELQTKINEELVVKFEDKIQKLVTDLSKFD